MGLQFRSFTMLVSLIWLFWWPRVEAQTPGPETSSARDLDAILQEYAYRGFGRGRTGIPYVGSVPWKLSGIQISALRLRRDSMIRGGFKTYKEFTIPVGLSVQPSVDRLVLVYQNLGNWDSYYPLQGHIYRAPILGLLAYDGSNLSAKNLPELVIDASDEDISITFKKVRSVPDGSVARCVQFDLNSVPNFTAVIDGNKCLTRTQGHFSIVVDSNASFPHPIYDCGGNNSRVWIIVTSVVSGLALVLLALLIFLILRMWRSNQSKTTHEMEKAIEAGPLQIHIPAR